MSNITQPTLDLADKLAKDVKIDAKTGEATVEPGLYTKHLPEGVTAESIEAAEDYKTTFTAAATIAVGEAGAKAFKANKDLERIDTRIDGHAGIGFDFSQQRHEEFEFRGNKTEKFGGINVKISHTAANKGAGDLKKARARVSELAQELLSK